MISFADSTGWRFVESTDDVDGTLVLVPLSLGGHIMTRSHWEQLQKDINLFFERSTDEQIERYNNRFVESPKIASEEPHPEIINTPKTVTGYIYLIYSEAGYYKIGKAIDPYSRKKTIGTEHPHKTRLYYTAFCLDYTRVERVLHEALAQYRMNGEWFNLPQEKIEWIYYHDWVDDLNLRGVVTDCERIPQ